MISYKDIIYVSVIALILTVVLIPITNTMADSLEVSTETEVQVYTPQFNVDDTDGPTTVINNGWIYDGLLDATKPEYGFTDISEIENMLSFKGWHVNVDGVTHYMFLFGFDSGTSIDVIGLIGTNKNIAEMLEDTSGGVEIIASPSSDYDNLGLTWATTGLGAVFTLDGWTITTEIIEDGDTKSTVESTLVRIIPILMFMIVILGSVSIINSRDGV